MNRPLDPGATSPVDHHGDAPAPVPAVHFLIPLRGGPSPVALIEQLTAATGPWCATLLVDASAAAAQGSAPEVASSQQPGSDDPRVQRCVVRDAADVGDLLRASPAGHLAVLDPRDRLAEPGGPWAWVHAADVHPDARVVVADELRRHHWGIERVFSPLPDRFSALVRPCTSGPVLLSAAAVREGDPGPVQDLDDLWSELVRRLAEDGGAVRHPVALVVRDESRPRGSAPRRSEQAAATAGIEVVTTTDGAPHLRGPGSSDGVVSVVLPTIGASGTVRGRPLVFVTALLDELLSAGHPELAEIVVVVDVATPPPVRSALEQVAASAAGGPIVVQLVEDPEGPFDFSRKVNLGVAHARGDVVLLLNDDVEGIAPRWMGSMCDLLRIDGVGVVGATLLYEDDVVQHAGVVAVEGIAGHFGQGRPWSSDFADRRWRQDRASLAVTGACLMTTRAVWDLVGGFSRTLPVNYNDLDFCLKARQLGLDVLVAADARLHHFESRSRVAEVEPSEYRTLAARWYDQLVLDPYHPGGFDVVAPRTGEEHVWPSKA
ncbi:MAG: glycosyltransferase family 2 protein [Microthrixaceae bacterium]